MTNTGTNAMTFVSGGGFDTYVAGSGAETIVSIIWACRCVTVKSFRVGGADKIALDISGVSTYGEDTFDIGGITLVNNTNIKAVADFDDLLLTALSNGGSGGFVFTSTPAISIIGRWRFLGRWHAGGDDHRQRHHGLDLRHRRIQVV